MGPSASSRQPRPNGNVIMFRPRGQESKLERSSKVVSQDRLRRVMNLQAEEARVVHELREQMLALQADIADGDVVEDGPLTFDPEIRTVKRAAIRARSR
jgi:hypothetical protein